MNVQSKSVFSILLLIVLAIATIGVARSQELPTVDSADPNFADQATTDVEVVLTGNNFDSTSEVEFLIPDTEDDGGVTVKKTKVRGSKKIVVTVDVDVAAVLGLRDIAVTSRRGRGRGTTFFHIFEQNSGKTCAPWPGCKEDPQNPDGGLDTCANVYGAPSCVDYVTGGDCVISRTSDNSPGFMWTGSCKTSHTLRIPANEPLLAGQGHTLYLVGPWQGGRAAIVNEGGSTLIMDLNIIANDPSLVFGCIGEVGDTAPMGAGILATAVSLNPHRGDSGLPATRPANLYISTLDSSGNPVGQFCNVLEYGSSAADPDFLATGGNPPFFPGGITDNIIERDSYSQFGLVTQYVNVGDGGDNVVTMTGNTVGHSSTACAGIKVGPHVERTNAGENEVTTPDCGVAGGVGIDVESAGNNDHALFQGATPATIQRNSVDLTETTGGVAIRISDSTIGKNDSNVVTCAPGNQSYDVTNVVDQTKAGLFPTKGKKRNILSDGTTITAAGPCP